MYCVIYKRKGMDEKLFRAVGNFIRMVTLCPVRENLQDDSYICFIHQITRYFCLGAPHLNSGMIVTSIVFTFILVSNTIAAVTAAKQVIHETGKDEKQTILGITLLIGVGLMFLRKGIFQGMPTIFQYIFSNGLIIGTIIVIVIEQLRKTKKHNSKGVSLNES